MSEETTSPAAQLRVMRREDIPAGLRLTRASHWNQLARDWELFLASGSDSCRVAVDGRGDVIGTVATLRYGGAFSWVAMVLVDPAHRGRGVGSLLLQEALRVLADMATVRLDATPAGHPVYARAGFVDEQRLRRMQRAARPPAVPAPAAHPVAGILAARVASPAAFVRLMQDADLDEIAVLDREAFGADRRAILAAFREQAPHHAWVSAGSGIDGYLFGRPGFSFEHIGPVVAADEATARDLVTACVSSNPGRPFIIDVPAWDSWTAFLETLGFGAQRPFIRMYRGAPPHRQLPDRMFAIAGPEFG